ncbi:hypothetical protein BKA57DRAFT_540383 [Linnemannia elongata]|nr:hypothetical protein BKA57DRAFT_540383 [Linnemannia elongata]
MKHFRRMIQSAHRYCRCPDSDNDSDTGSMEEDDKFLSTATEDVLDHQQHYSTSQDSGTLTFSSQFVRTRTDETYTSHISACVQEYQTRLFLEHPEQSAFYQTIALKVTPSSSPFEFDTLITQPFIFSNVLDATKCVNESHRMALSPGDLPTPASSSRFLKRKVHHGANSSSITEAILPGLDQDDCSEDVFSSDSGSSLQGSRKTRRLDKSISENIPHALPLGSPEDVLVPVITVNAPESTEATTARESETVQLLQPEGGISRPPQPPIPDPTGSYSTDRPSPLITSALRYGIFLADATKPTVLSPTPIHPRAPMESTLQLVHCARMLLEDQHRSTSQCNPTEVYVLDDAGRHWFDAIQEDPSAQTRIRWLVSRLVKEFLKDPFLGPEAIFEVVVLGPVLCQADYRDLLSCFIERFDQSALLNASLLQGVIQLLQSAPSGFLTDDDLVRVLSSLRKRLESTHAPDRAHVYQLVYAVSKVLQVMVRGEVKGLNRQRDHQSLLAAFRNLKGVDDDEFLKFQVSYAYQMSLYLPEDETSFQAFWRFADTAADGVSAVASVFKLDPMSALATAEHIQQVAGNANDVVKFNIDRTQAFQATSERDTQAAGKVYWSQEKHPWFLALQAGYRYVLDGRLVDFNALVCDVTCRDDINFQRGVCQILGEVALNPLWDDGSRRSAIDFLGELCKPDVDRRKDVEVRKWVATILQQISSSTSSAVSSHACILLGDLQQGYALDIEGCRALHTPLPIPTVFPLLERALSITDIDHELACIRFRSLEECLHPVSIPLRAKATLLAPEDQSFPLMAKVHEFLASDKLVFLLLGDSGSGKSTFCRQLERELWNHHQRSDGGRIPLYINLPSIDDPHCSLIEKYLKHHHNILESIIQNIKDRQQFVLICDGYDESRLIQNLYTTNRLNRPGQWNVKMIVTCRSTFLGQEYQYRFYPIGDNIYHNNSFCLFEEATIVPFQERDIQDYILHFATQEPLDTPPTQRYQDYWRKLSAIPNLKDLVSNPFLLTLALKELPKLSDDLQDLARIKVTRLKLFDGFFKEWTRINIARLQRSNLSPEYRFVFKDLLDYGFAKCVKDFLKSLATAIYRHQSGRSVVFFSSKHNEPWKVEFFSREVKPTLLRSASPLKQAGIQHSFIHGSLLNYFDSLTLFDPFDSDDDDGSDDSDGDGDSWGGGDDFHSGGGNSLGDGSDGLADGNDNSTGGNGESIGGDTQSTGNNGGSSGGNGGSSGGNGGSTSGNQDSSGGVGDSSGGSSGNSSGGDNDSSRGDKNGSNGDEDGSRKLKDGVRSNRNGNATKSRSSSSSDPFSERNLFKEPSVLQFLVERAESDLRLKKRLFSAIEQAKASSVPSMAAANAITILFKSGDLSQDVVLGGVPIPSDYISTATESMEPAQLPESNLTGRDLVKVLVTLTTPESESTVPATAFTVPVSAPTVPASMPFSATVAQKTSTAPGKPSRSVGKNRPPLMPPMPKPPPYSTLDLKVNSVLSQAGDSPSGDNQFASSSTSPSGDNQSISYWTAKGKALSVIFAKDVPKHATMTELPQLQQRIEMTQQLVYCNALLLRDAFSSPKSGTGEAAEHSGPLVLQEPALDKTELDWLETTKKDPLEADRLRWLATRMVEQFIADANKDSTKVAEIVTLGPVLEKEPYRKLLAIFIKMFDDARILDVDILQGLVQLVQDASPSYLLSDDLLKILKIFRERLEGTHRQPAQNSYYLTLAVSRILDVMADHKVQDLDRVLEHEPLLDVLSGLKGNSDPYLLYQTCYAFQALLYVPNDKTVLGAVFKHTTGVADSLAMVTAVFKLDVESALEGLGNLQEALSSVKSLAGTVYDGVSSLKESGQGVLESLRVGLGIGQKQPWYPAVKVAYAFAQAGQLKDLKQLIFEVPCRHDHFFQWGISQLLGEIAVDALWPEFMRQQSISLLSYLYQYDQDWGLDESVKTWTLTIIANLCASSDKAVSETARSVLQDLTVDQSDLIKHHYPLRVCLPLPSTSPILAEVQNIRYLEYELHKFRLQRLEEAQLPVYISPMAKANLQAHDDDVFPLMDKVQEFLASDRQVMLILGDSLAGKSTFARYLESVLLQSYNRGGRVPLFINLPLIERPVNDLIGEHLKTSHFSEAQIQELRQYRQFVLICDGYDESQLTVNLHTSNLFNRPREWNVKLLITCRTQYLGPDYRGRFIPEGTGNYIRQATDLFQEAVIVPFSKEQIEDFVERYVPLEPRTWTTKDYMERLTTIPNLLDLVKNPFLLSLALEVLPGVTTEQEMSTIKITRVQLYDTFAYHWLGVNKRRLQNNRLDVDRRAAFEALLEDGFEQIGHKFQQDLAAAIFVHQDGRPVVDYTHRRDKSSWKGSFFNIDCETSLLRGASLLSRTGTQYRFVHRSILEYFFACIICGPNGGQDELGPLDVSDTSAKLSTISTHSLSHRNLVAEPSIIQFLAERVQLDSGFKNKLLTIIELSKTDNQATQAAANAITILVKAGVQFNRADLRGIRIPGADISGGQFDSVQLQEPDLTGVNLTKSWIRQADFTRAQMDGVQFGEMLSLKESEGVYSCAYSPDGTSLAVGLGDGRVNTYDTSTWTMTRTFERHQRRVRSIAYSPTSCQLISGSEDSTVRLWDCMSGSCVFVLKGHTNEVWTVAFSPSGMQAASAGRDKTVNLWDVQTGANLSILTGHTDWIRSISFSPNGQEVVSVGEDRMIRFFDSHTGELGEVWESESGRMNRVAYSPSGLEIAVGHGNGELLIYNTTTGKPTRSWKAHEEAVAGLSFSPDSQRVATCSSDNTVKVWSAVTGLALSIFTSHGSSVCQVAFSPSGLQLASCSLDCTIRLWDMNRVLDMSSLVGTDDKFAAVWNIGAGQADFYLHGYTERSSNSFWKFGWSNSSLRLGQS